MATDEWKQENPKVSGHIPKHLKEQLDQLITDQGLKSTSEALRIILENHFNQSELSTSSQLLGKSSQPVLNSNNEQLNRIEVKLEKLYKTVKTQTKNLGVVNSVLNSEQKSCQLVLNSEEKSCQLVDNPEKKSSQLVLNRSQHKIFDEWGGRAKEIQK